MFNSRFLFIIAALLPLHAMAGLPQGDLIPDNVGQVKVTDFGARCDAVTDSRGFTTGTDDTTAIQRAFNEAAKTVPSIVQFPAPVPPATTRKCLVSDTIKAQTGETIVHQGVTVPVWRSYIEVIGASTAAAPLKTVLQLRDGAVGFRSSKQPKPVLKLASQLATGDAAARALDGAGDSAFMNGVRNIAIDCGVGNEGCAGISFISNNTGWLRQVRVQSRDFKSSIGVEMLRYATGPVKFENLSIDGFEVGMSLANKDYGVVLENVSIRRSRSAGIKNAGEPITARKLSITSSAVNPAFLSVNANSFFYCLDCTFGGLSADDPTVPVMSGPGAFFLQDSRVSGYATLYGNTPATATVGYFATLEASRTNTSDQITPLRLPIVETPATFYPTLESDWLNIEDFGATPLDASDDTMAIQAAMDACKTSGRQVLVHGAGKQYQMNGVVSIPSCVRTFEGLQSIFARTSATLLPKFVIEAGNTPITLRGWRFGSNTHGAQIEQGDRELVLKDVIAEYTSYHGTAAVPKRLFVDDASVIVTLAPKQQLFARQLNSENPITVAPFVDFLNDGGTAWILGFKTENIAPASRTMNGGRTEILGGLVYPVGAPAATTAMHEVLGAGSEFFAVHAQSCYTCPQRLYQRNLLDTRDGTEKVLGRTGRHLSISAH